MNKKALSLLLALSMVFSMNTAAFAGTKANTEAVEVIETQSDLSKAQSGNQSNNSQSRSEKTISVNKYAVVVSYNSVLSFTGKKLNVKDLAPEVKVYNTVSGQASGNALFTATLKGKFDKNDSFKGKALGAANFTVKGIKAVKGTSKDNKKIAKEIAKSLKSGSNKLEVTVKALSLSCNGVVSANNLKKKDAKAKLTAGTNYVVSLKYNSKKPEKSKVTVYYTQSGKVKASKLKNGKKGVKLAVVSGNIVLTGSVEGELKK